MKELKSKIIEALISALPITAIVYLLSLTPWFNFSGTELITFTVGAVMLVLGIGLFNMGADLAMTPIGTHVESGLSRQKNLPLLLGVGISAILGDRRSKDNSFGLVARERCCRPDSAELGEKITG